jgi:hypothetical protein
MKIFGVGGEPLGTMEARKQAPEQVATEVKKKDKEEEGEVKSEIKGPEWERLLMAKPGVSIREGIAWVRVPRSILNRLEICVSRFKSAWSCIPILSRMKRYSLTLLL